ncbi:MAG: 16S rRNA (cytosine(967)-C(5))-methyltransferase RsmB [Velocimicrobium sp.]
MTRELVLDVLIEVLENGGYSNVVLHNMLKKYQYMDKQNRAFLTRLSEGVIERCIEIDYVINSFSTVKVKKMKPVIRAILRMGTYQILYMDQVPDSAACNEAVKLAKKKGFGNLKGFVNGVLRSIARQKEALKWPQKGSKEYLSVMYSMPQWILDMWLEEYDYPTVESICKGFFEEKKTTIRVNTNKITIDDLRNQFDKEEVTVEAGRYLPYALYISNYNYLSGLSSFKEGLFQVQDESSMMIAQCAGIKEGQVILDVCAAPGGKSTHAAQLLNETGQVIARDLTEYKTGLIEENVNRLGLKNVTIQCQDALSPDHASKESADIVLADLPCTGLGVIKRKGDIKYKTEREDVDSLSKLQRDILSVVTDYVKPGGVLIYSTCTINKYENMDNVTFLLDNFDFELETLVPYLPEKLKKDSKEKGYVQLLPGVDETDGFFLARLRKRKE